MNKLVSLRIFQFVILIFISGFIGYFIGTNRIAYKWTEFKPILQVESKEPPVGSELDMRLFYDTLDRVSRDYYDPSKIDSQKVLHGAISGMLASLEDPYTSFFPPKQNTEFKQQLAGEFHGIGAELGMTAENVVMVIAPLEGSPAIKAGIKPGDLILRVDEADTRGWTLAQAVEKIRGPKDSTVKLTILHEGSDKSTELSIIRDVIKIDSVRGWVKQVACEKDGCQEKKDCLACNSVAYIRLSQFGDRTNEEWIKVANQIASDVQEKNKLKGVILDVRNNPGGYLNDAVYIASEFLEKGTVVMQEDNSGSRKEMNVTRRGLLTTYPIIVLINKGSASASEIVAGALRDHKRARLLGENSFGKGTIQEAVDVGQGASVHISVAKWLTPNGTWVNKVGLKPDVEVKFDEKSASNAAKFDNQIQAAIEELTK